MDSGYSGTSLAKKLGLKNGYIAMWYQEPEDYFLLFSDFPDDIKVLTKAEPESVDFVHLFCTSFEELHTQVANYKPLLKKSGLIWISWPKGSSKISTDLKRDPIRTYLLEIGLVDTKVAAISSDWSGLKFVYRLKDR